MGAADVVVVGFGTNKKWSSKMIRRATNSWCSHAWIEYSSPKYGIYAVHAQPDGVVRQRVFSVWDNYPVFRRYELRLRPRDIRLAIEYAIDQMGTPYDYGAIVNTLKLWWWRETSIFTNPVRNPRELHCSELVTHIFRRVDVTGVDKLDPELTSPGKLWNFVHDNDQFRML